MIDGADVLDGDFVGGGVVGPPSIILTLIAIDIHVRKYSIPFKLYKQCLSNNII